MSRLLELLLCALALVHSVVCVEVEVGGVISACLKNDLSACKLSGIFEAAFGEQASAWVQSHPLSNRSIATRRLRREHYSAGRIMKELQGSFELHKRHVLCPKGLLEVNSFVRPFVSMTPATLAMHLMHAFPRISRWSTADSSTPAWPCARSRAARCPTVL